VTGHKETVRASSTGHALRRRLNLPLLVLYGVGITVGAGIYVLIGSVAAHAGVYAPWSFLIAAVIMAFTVASYAELTIHFPVSAGEAAYVRHAFNSRYLSILTGLTTIFIGMISSATVAVGSAGYISQFIDAPRVAIVVAVVLILGLIAAWGILESVVLASIFTLVEVGGLLAIIAAAGLSDFPIISVVMQPPPMILAQWSGIFFASLLAFFAFIGFEDLANVVEEAKTPHLHIPWAMFLTLAISTGLYIAVAAIAVSAVSPGRLASSPAPLSLVFQEVAGISPTAISAIAIVATLNTILAQMTMATRVIYGLAREGDLPAFLGEVHARTATPLAATALMTVMVIVLALAFRFEALAEVTSLATLVIFVLVNASLLRLRFQRTAQFTSHLGIPTWVPVAGIVSSLAMIASALLS
jgi:amino acid transporter